ncbi:MAG: 2-amino-4-hydroxy-6-hydroxymethyldihydropteridine diphosphokinase [Mesoaciditoga sp.]|uniref:2-amino-4-hydroxy-6- hydroxymethyldihydropteridine diphosphokinase n=1 Tax=Athalassotoga sp. TaxID=2022597 RepID=UPI000CB7658F|nr:MAG: 2-amino-4-hydroxy-6-hydroxymethyldihydropteridine diphosphokinase [Mesoaciditoga sp.]HEU23866.1 2-amino-4-hydroxy-6-hydroxymethyldihydropteridine diphosphokinase [Mesoaciditoga lauensis]
MEHLVYVAFGSNLGDRKENILRAIEEMKKKQMEFLRISTMYETEPYGLKDQPKFINCAALIRTSYAPMELMDMLLDIEKALGRVRNVKWGPRTIDIDILFYDHRIINFVDLIIPHPDLQNREFVLRPLAEIAPDYIHPKLKKSVFEMLNEIEGVKI